MIIFLCCYLTGVAIHLALAWMAEGIDATALWLTLLWPVSLPHACWEEFQGRVDR